MNIQEKLMHTQLRLKAPKSQFNKFGNYNYRSCEDILEALKPILTEVKAIVTLKDKIIQIGNRFYVEATATITDTEDTSSNISVTAYAREEESKKGMDASQITGSVSSYARKYALNGLFCIDDTKDSDATNKHGKEATETPKQEKKYKCKDCNTETTEKVAKYSYNKYKKVLCVDCQKKQK
ncbi:ERF family protein [Anaerophilus nitritogenes]|uniref:ERF family protein n=1 Tax=Anaerophilus nitritogenes TaxID=2498136 RepID=UPI00101E05D4|nr:ERF family protein [Anaerophilus nitritogenes]